MHIKISCLSVNFRVKSYFTDMMNIDVYLHIICLGKVLVADPRLDGLKVCIIITVIESMQIIKGIAQLQNPFEEDFVDLKFASNLLL